MVFKHCQIFAATHAKQVLIKIQDKMMLLHPELREQMRENRHKMVAMDVRTDLTNVKDSQNHILVILPNSMVQLSRDNVANLAQLKQMVLTLKRVLPLLTAKINTATVIRSNSKLDVTMQLTHSRKLEMFVAKPAHEVFKEKYEN
jgi:hypothetical protein